MEGVAEPQWEHWRSLAIPTTAVFAADGMFSADEQADFVAARPGTRCVTLTSGSHDAHLDATAEWAKTLRDALNDLDTRG
jgi:pimeloyl-ACP methyl ester carboxylesterase